MQARKTKIKSSAEKKYALKTCVNKKEGEKKKDNTQSFKDT